MKSLTISILALLFFSNFAAANGRDGDGSVEISGELKEWHKVSLTLDGPFARRWQ